MGGELLNVILKFVNTRRTPPARPCSFSPFAQTQEPRQNDYQVVMWSRFSLCHILPVKPKTIGRMGEREEDSRLYGSAGMDNPSFWQTSDIHMPLVPDRLTLGIDDPDGTVRKLISRGHVEPRCHLDVAPLSGQPQRTRNRITVPKHLNDRSTRQMRHIRVIEPELLFESCFDPLSVPTRSIEKVAYELSQPEFPNMGGELLNVILKFRQKPSAASAREDGLPSDVLVVL